MIIQLGGLFYDTFVLLGPHRLPPPCSARSSPCSRTSWAARARPAGTGQGSGLGPRAAPGSHPPRSHCFRRCMRGTLFDRKSFSLIFVLEKLANAVMLFSAREIDPFYRH